MSDYSPEAFPDDSNYQPTKCLLFMRSVYNPSKHQLLGRTLGSWGRIVLFYLVFYGVLSGFFIGMLAVFLVGTVKYDKPSRTGMQSMLKMKPGLGMRPMVAHQSTLIKYSANDPQTYIPYTENLHAFFDYYEEVNTKPKDGFAECPAGLDAIKSFDDIDKVCRFDLNQLGPCHKSNNFGFDKNMPCVVVKMNQIFGWMPQVKNDSETDHPLLKCTGQNPADVENFGKVRYYPSFNTSYGEEMGYFSHNYYPYLGQPAYRPPVVAVQFDNPRKHVLLMVRCELVNLKETGETLRFEILVD